MATRLQKLVLTLVCGTAIGFSRCHRPEVEHPPSPPPDMAADAGTDDAEAEPGLEAVPSPHEDEKIAMYGAPVPDDLVPPEPEDQPMYGVVYSEPE